MKRKHHKPNFIWGYEMMNGNSTSRYMQPCKTHLSGQDTDVRVYTAIRYLEQK
jgi:hypothetical protein